MIVQVYILNYDEKRDQEDRRKSKFKKSVFNIQAIHEITQENSSLQ